jgi:hypothetical protein
MNDEDLAAMLFENGRNQKLPIRGWACPADHLIAAYADGALDERSKARLEEHLADCPHCRLIVADVIRAQMQLDLPEPPHELMRKAVGTALQGPASWGRIWVRLGALASIVLVGTLAVVFRDPGQVIVLSPPALPPAPVIAKSEAVAVPREPVHDIIRKPRTTDPVPTILFPMRNSVVKSDRLQIRWKAIPQSQYYGIRVVTSDGDLVWDNQTEKSTLWLPSDAALKEGSYFVWVTANLADGRIAKSPPVRFLVKQ